MRVTSLRCVALAAAVASGSLGCAATRDSAAPLVRVRAEKDLMCPQDRIALERRWGGKYVAVGCGRRVTYDSVCDGIQCQVSREGREAPAWRGRPDPGSPYHQP